MTLYLIRHAEALTRQEAGVDADADRPLSPSGLRAIQGVGRQLRAHGVKPTSVVSSPLLRARQTAEQLAGLLDWTDAPMIWEMLSPDREADEALEEMRKRRLNGTVLAIGHQPLLGHVIAQLLRGQLSNGISLRPGSVCELQLPAFPRTFQATLGKLWQPEV